MATNKPRLDPTLMGEAKILVDVELNKPFPQRIAAEDKKGTISMIDVEYSWLPSKCCRCGQLGHKESRCLLNRKIVVESPAMEMPKTLLVPETSTCVTSEDANVVVVPHISSEANVVVVPHISSEAIISVSSDTSLENTTNEEVAMPLMRTTTTSEETLIKDHETTPVVVEAASIIEASVTSSKITSIPEISTFSSPQFLASSGSLTIPLVVEPNRCETMLENDGVLSTPESSDTDVDHVPSSSQRFLRERPVQPSLKYHENEWISIGSSRRGKHNRGGRRGRRD